MNTFTVRELSASDWRRMRDFRLSSLLDSEDAFGGSFEEEKMFVESQWRAIFEKLRFLVAATENIGAGILSIENLEGDFGATCWIGGCWVDPRFRGKGVMRALISYVDEHADENDWGVQGLGVWTDNDVAINAYLALGFVRSGEDIESRKHPGKSYVRMIRKR